MAELFSIEQQRKRDDYFNADTCIFCSEVFSIKKPATKSKRDNLISACKQRGDDVGKRICEKLPSLLCGDETLSYHKSCRATYTSSFHINLLLKKKRIRHQFQRQYVPIPPV